MSEPSAAPSRRVLWGVAVVCFSNLMLEVLLTRIFSATMFYHFTFLAIALALFGMGTSGVYVYIHSDRYTPGRVLDDLAANARRFGASTIVALMYVLSNPINLGVSGAPSTFGKDTLVPLILLNGVTALPFFFAGMVVSLSVLHYRACIDRVYFFDLAGAAVAALLVGLLLGWLGAPSLVLAIAALAVGSALLFRKPTKLSHYVPLVLAVVLVVVNLAWPVISVRSGKSVKSERVVFEKWNVFSRVAVERIKKDGRLDITIDASAKTTVAHINKARGKGHLARVESLAYSLHDTPAEHVLIIGPGGGLDVTYALASGAKRVTGVEINPIIVDDVMKGKFVADTGGLYEDGRVRIVVDEGRSFIRRSSEKYDVIQATLVDTWAATASGAFALTENTLYTVEAFEDYYRHLSDDGVVTMSRWVSSRDPEVARLLLLAAAGLTKVGVDERDARKHIVMAHKGALGTLLAKRSPFTAAELAGVEQAAQRGGFKIIVSPTTSGTHQWEKLLDAGPSSAFAKQQRHDLSPPTDNRPFFFYFNKPGDILRLRLHDKKLMNPGTWILIAFGAAICALTLIFILLPLVVHRSSVLRGPQLRSLPRRLLGLFYFGMIGLAFITIEIALMQKLGLFLGHPSYGLIVVLFSILVATALGARFSGRIPDRRREHVSAGAAIAIALLCLVYSGVLDGVLRDWITMGLTARIIVATLAVAIAGAMMGLMLPLGIRMLSDRDHEVIPWAWGINGATSVIGTVTATIIAIHYGFNATLRVGAALYVLAGLSMLVLAKLVATKPFAAGARDREPDEEE